jgi:hypothetical protein
MRAAANQTHRDHSIGASTLTIPFPLGAIQAFTSQRRNQGTPRGVMLLIQAGRTDGHLVSFPGLCKSLFFKFTTFSFRCTIMESFFCCHA